MKNKDILSWCNIHNRPTDESCCCSECEEEVELVLCPKCDSVKIDPCGRGGKRCYDCGHIFGAD